MILDKRALQGYVVLPRMVIIQYQQWYEPLEESDKIHELKDWVALSKLWRFCEHHLGYVRIFRYLYSTFPHCDECCSLRNALSGDFECVLPFFGESQCYSLHVFSLARRFSHEVLEWICQFYPESVMRGVIDIVQWYLDYRYIPSQDLPYIHMDKDS